MRRRHVANVIAVKDILAVGRQSCAESLDNIGFTMVLLS